MPQMAPISWLTLFIMFTMTLIMFCMMNYFIIIPKSLYNSNMTSMKKKMMNWKW